MLATAIVVPATAAQACSCGLGTPTERLDRADAVFIGEVVARKGKRVEEVNENVFIGGQFTYTFAVERVYKGEVDVNQRVAAGVDGAACGIVLNPGQTYLVYGTAGNTLGVKAAPDEYSTHLCSGTGKATTAPAVYGDGEPPIGAPVEPPLSTPTDPDLDTSASAVPTSAVVAGAAILGLALIVVLLYLRRRRSV